MEIINNKYISAFELHKELVIQKQFSQWIKYNIKRAYLEEGKHFITKLLESTGGRRTTDYLLNEYAAITIAVISGGKNAKNIRDEIVLLYKNKRSGLAFTTDQILMLIDLSKAMTLISIQKKVERKHFDIYNHPETWHKYRANLLGYSKKTLIEAMKKVNLKHKSIRASLIKLDANELIRTGIIDLFKALGKSNEYATNVGNLCKKFAKEMKLENIIWDDTKDNPLKLNKPSVENRKQLLDNNIEL